jgi:DNA invertase Pin-like site-specific DNA recombinase
MQVAIYVRVSADDKGQDSENQLRELRDWIVNSSHYKDHFVDAGFEVDVIKSRLGVKHSFSFIRMRSGSAFATAASACSPFSASVIS